ncbi:MAG: B12-binding domain-containing radical SAM protein [Nitrospinota bacterium]|nr:B12-binding domain-containing radical SAM protein [Nitrospinota bacterium]
MKCALVIPPWQPGDIFPEKTASSQINYWQPLGTLYVGAVLKNAGHDVVFLNGAFLSNEEILEKLHQFKPGFAGIYSTAFGWKGAVRLASDIRKRTSNVFITAGGPYPSAAKGGALNGAEDIDAVVTGEGEVTVPELVKRLEKGESLAGLEGVIYRESGEIVSNNERKLIDDLDSIPFPARELLGDFEKYLPAPATYRRKPVAVMMTSRGCDRKCIFCFQFDRERKSGIRYRSVENVMEEIESCLRAGYREIKFIDDTFTSDYDRAMRIASEIKRRKLDFTWFASAIVNQVDKPLLKAFKEAGCWAILFGAESGVQANLNTLRKGTTVEQVRKGVREAKEAGLKVFTPFLIGIPGETRENLQKTIDFTLEIDPDVVNFHYLTPFPGTELHDNIAKYGSMSDDLTEYTYQGGAFVPHSMSRGEMAEMRNLAFRKFYTRPRFLFRRTLGLRSADDLKAAFSGLKSLFWILKEKALFRRKKEKLSGSW